MDGWKIDRYNESMIRVTKGEMLFTLQGKPNGGGFEFEQFEEGGEDHLIWDGQVCRLHVTKQEDGNIKFEITQPNGFPVVLMNGLPVALFAELKTKATAGADVQRPAARPSAAPAAGGRRKTRKVRRSRAKWHNEYSQ